MRSAPRRRICLSILQAMKSTGRAERGIGDHLMGGAGQVCVWRGYCISETTRHLNVRQTEIMIHAFTPTADLRSTRAALDSLAPAGETQS